MKTNTESKETGTRNSSKKSDGSIGSLLYLMVSPVEGWKRIKGSTVSPDVFARRMFYPLIALASALTFMQLVHDQSLEVAQLVENALITFMAWFIGYFIAVMILKLTPAGANQDFLKKFVMTVMSSLLIFYIIYEIVPLLEPIMVFTPIYSIYLIYRGSRFLKFPAENTTVLIGVTAIVIVGMFPVLSWLFGMMIPGVE